MAQFNYTASRTCALFHMAPVGSYDYKGIRGGVASGKSVACCLDLFLKANEQEAVEVEGRLLRWVRYLIGRNTFPALKQTTIETWLQWFPQTEMHWSPPIKGRLELPSIHNDGSWVRLDLEFYALESNTIKNDLMSLELSGAWINEASQTDWEIIHLANSRIGRFQPVKGRMLRSFGTIMDTNAPSDSNWWYRKEQVEKPERMLWFVQPPAMIREKDADGNVVYLDNDAANAAKYGIWPAENVENLRDGFGYWRKMLTGGDPDVIKRLVLNQYGTSFDGLPIYGEWNAEIHKKRGLQYQRGLPLVIGHDFGRTPAAVFLQMGADGIVRVLGEETSQGMGIQQFIEERLRPRLLRQFGWPSTKVLCFCDPAGVNMGDQFNVSCINVLNAYGIPSAPAPGLKNNDFNIRRDAVAELMRSIYRGVPAFQVDDSCTELIGGFNGGYCYRRMRTAVGGGEDRFADGPDKSNPFTHVQDALQYGVLGLTKSGVDFGSVSAMDPMLARQNIRGLVDGTDFGCV